MFLALPLIALSVAITGCDGCDRSGYEALRVRLVSSSPAPPVLAEGCSVYTDIPLDTTSPDQHGEALRHIGRSVYECLNGTAASGEAGPAFYDETLWFRINGQCPSTESFTYYGCFSLDCRTVDTDLAHIGPQSTCPAGTPMEQWDEACWTQFYTVLGHEVMHGWLGAFH